LPITDTASKPEWDRALTAKSSWLNLNLTELWRYRDLIYLFVKRDFVGTYKQTIPGIIIFRHVERSFSDTI
jgi:lipopolysaccharide transport system permease protein